jgi:hypothetical protein
MDNTIKEIIEKFFEQTSSIFTELGRINPGCALLRQDNSIFPLVPKEDNAMTFYEYFEACASIAKSEPAKYLLLACEQKIDGKRFLTILCHNIEIKEDDLPVLLSEISSDIKGTRYTAKTPEWITQDGEIDIVTD